MSDHVERTHYDESEVCDFVPPKSVRMGIGSIETYSGLQYDYAEPDPANIKLRDVSHALANMCRFAGHTQQFYSVAEHSVFVSKILQYWGESQRVQVAGLFHDGHEAYVWDCPRPLKPLLGERFAEFAAAADVAICEALLPTHEPEDFHTPTIKRADNAALVYEGMRLMKRGPRDWHRWRPEEVDEVPHAAEPQYGNLGVIPPMAKVLFEKRCLEFGNYITTGEQE